MLEKDHLCFSWSTRNNLDPETQSPNHVGQATSSALAYKTAIKLVQPGIAGTNKGGGSGRQIGYYSNIPDKGANH